jgi:predicted enzyme related to lactoylglutathione lyase
MGTRESHEPGTFSWADLATTDARGARKFYTGLFGWEPVKVPAGEAGTYTMLRRHGHDVAAIYEQGPEERKQGAPPHWSSYVTVASADEAAGRVPGLGGTVIAEPFDVMQAGRMAIVADPGGAVLSLWEPRESIGAELVNDVGALCWNELGTADTEGARRFYGGLLGWEFETDQNGYSMILNSGRRNGGIRPQAENEAGGPPYWSVCFSVESAGETAAEAQARRGKPLVPPTEFDIGRFAVIADPQGAVFAIFEGETDP